MLKNRFVIKNVAATSPFGKVVECRKVFWSLMVDLGIAIGDVSNGSAKGPETGIIGGDTPTIKLER